MTELKVTSKKYNDKDILQVENFEQAVKTLTDPELLKKANRVEVSDVSALENDEIESLNVCDIIFDDGGYSAIVCYKDEIIVTVLELPADDGSGRIDYYSKISDTWELDSSVGFTWNALAEITKVQANPTLVGTESALTSIEIGGTKYKVDEVVANPTLAGTESALTGLQVGDTKYKVSGGTQLYKHSFTITDDNSNEIPVVIISDRLAQYNTSTLTSDIKNGKILNVVAQLSQSDDDGCPIIFTVDQSGFVHGMYFSPTGSVVRVIELIISMNSDSVVAL